MSHGGPPLYRCAGCGCPVNDHAGDFGERRECTVCECRQYEEICGECAEDEEIVDSAIFADRWLCAWAVVGEAVRIKPSFDLGSVSRLVHDNAELRAEVESMRAVVEAARVAMRNDWECGRSDVARVLAGPLVALIGKKGAK